MVAKSVRSGKQSPVPQAVSWLAYGIENAIYFLEPQLPQQHIHTWAFFASGSFSIHISETSVLDVPYVTPTFCFQGVLEWPFWTKLVVVAIGFTGGLVFMYVQCKVYVQLWRRLKAYNRVIFVQNCPDTVKKLEEKSSPCTQASEVKDAVVVPVAHPATNSQPREEEATSEAMPV